MYAAAFPINHARFTSPPRSCLLELLRPPGGAGSGRGTPGGLGPSSSRVWGGGRNEAKSNETRDKRGKSGVLEPGGAFVPSLLGSSASFHGWKPHAWLWVRGRCPRGGFVGRAPAAEVRLEAAEKLWAPASKPLPKPPSKRPAGGSLGRRVPRAVPGSGGRGHAGGGFPLVRGSVLLLLLFYNFLFFLFSFFFSGEKKPKRTERGTGSDARHPPRHGDGGGTSATEQLPNLQILKKKKKKGKTVKHPKEVLKESRARRCSAEQAEPCPAGASRAPSGFGAPLARGGFANPIPAFVLSLRSRFYFFFFFPMKRKAHFHK